MPLNHKLSLTEFCLAGGALLFFSVTFLYLYRLFFHPLARYPGPKLAAATNWYEFYYEVIKAGAFTHHIQTLHKQYGESIIVTISVIRLGSG
jgi:hypothetical protein